MKTYILSDTHFNHDKIKTYCERPDNFTELIIKNNNAIVKPEDLVIYLGDIAIGDRRKVSDILREMNGRKVLAALGNHDYCHSLTWWMRNGFDFAADATVYRNVYLTHKPATFLPYGCKLNVHGHLHNIWHGFHGQDGEPTPTRLHNDWQRLFALEYTNYAPVEFQKFIEHPDKYQAMAPNKETLAWLRQSKLNQELQQADAESTNLDTTIPTSERL